MIEPDCQNSKRILLAMAPTFLEARTLRRLKRCCRDFESSVKSAGRDEMKIGVELSTGRVGWLSSRAEAAAGEAEEEYLAHWG